MIPNKWFDDLADLGYSGTLNDRMFNWLESKGYSGTLNDMMHAWLGDEGYTGVFGERLAKYLSDGNSPDALLVGATLTRAGDGTYWDDTGTLQTAGPNMLRQDHDPATGAYRGVLVEESRTNRLTESTDFSVYTNTGLTLTADASTGPNGTASMTKLTPTAVSSAHYLRALSSGSGVYPVTIYARAAGYNYLLLKRSSGVRNATFDLANGTIVSDSASIVVGSATVGDLDATIEHVGNDIYKCTYIQGAASILDIGVNETDLLDAETFTGDGTSGIEIFGFCEETGTFATSTILSDGTATTRPDDVLTNSFSESSGTIHLVGEHVGGDGVLWQADDGTENNRIRLEVSSGNVVLGVTSGGVSQASLTLGALDSSGVYDAAFRFDTNDIAGSLDGATAVTDTTATVPTVTTGRFGADTSGPTGRNWYKTSDYRTALLSDSQLEALTA